MGLKGRDDPGFSFIAIHGGFADYVCRDCGASVYHCDHDYNPIANNSREAFELGRDWKEEEALRARMVSVHRERKAEEVRSK